VTFVFGIASEHTTLWGIASPKQTRPGSRETLPTDPSRGRQISWKHGILRGLYFCRCESQTGDSQMAPRLIPYEALKAKSIMYSKPHLWRLEKAGKFPKRVPVGASRYAYIEAEIDAHINALIAARDEAKVA
jgi:prophage regulatory protein